MTFKHRTTYSFWDWYAKLPEDVRDRADKHFEILKDSPGHPSLQLKPAGDLWSARVTDACRALAIRDGNVFTWFWIGPHDEHLRLLKG